MKLSRGERPARPIKRSQSKTLYNTLRKEERKKKEREEKEQKKREEEKRKREKEEKKLEDKKLEEERKRKEKELREREKKSKPVFGVAFAEVCQRYETYVPPFFQAGMVSLSMSLLQVNSSCRNICCQLHFKPKESLDFLAV